MDMLVGDDGNSMRARRRRLDVVAPSSHEMAGEGGADGWSGASWMVTGNEKRTRLTGLGSEDEADTLEARDERRGRIGAGSGSAILVVGVDSERRPGKRRRWKDWDDDDDAAAARAGF